MAKPLRATIVVAAIGGVGWVLFGQSGAGDDLRPRALAREEPRTTASTSVELVSRSYAAGDCVRWDEAEYRGIERPTKVVPCTDPHLIEITGRATAPDGVGYPSEDAWQEWFETGPCRTYAEKHLGRPLDDNGRYLTGGIQPLEAGWTEGDRRVHCGIVAVPTRPHPDDRLFVMTAPVDGTDQALYFEVGACVPPDDSSPSFRLVTCDQPHTVEVVGHTVLPDGPSAPTGDAFIEIVRADCELLVRAYIGGPIEPPIWWSAFPIDDSSWQLGQRKTECLVHEVDANYDDVVISRSLRAAAAA